MVVQEEDGPARKKTYVAADVVGAGIGERVLVVSGSTARGVFGGGGCAGGYGHRGDYRQPGNRPLREMRGQGGERG